MFFNITNIQLNVKGRNFSTDREKDKIQNFFSVEKRDKIHITKMVRDGKK